MVSKNHRQELPLPSELEPSLSKAWRRFVQRLEAMDAGNRGQWSKVDALGLLNSFLNGHYEVARECRGHYKELENELLKRASLETDNMSSVSQESHESLSQAAIENGEEPSEYWRLLLAKYCGIHFRRTRDWCPWTDNDYREFVDAARLLASQFKTKASLSGT